MLFDTLLEDYSPLNNTGGTESATGEENEMAGNESKSKPKVRGQFYVNDDVNVNEACAITVNYDLLLSMFQVVFLAFCFYLE